MAKYLSLFAASLLIFSVHAKVIMEDALIFKIVDQIYSVGDVQKIYQDYLQLKCFFPEEKIGGVAHLTEAKIEDQIFQVGESITPEQRKHFSHFKTLVKLMTYVDAQNVAVDSKLRIILGESFEELKCSKIVFRNSTPPELTPSFEKMLKLHIFLRSRYANEEANQGKEISGLNLFVDSVDKQISETVYW